MDAMVDLDEARTVFEDARDLYRRALWDELARKAAQAVPGASSVKLTVMGPGDDPVLTVTGVDGHDPDEGGFAAEERIEAEAAGVLDALVETHYPDFGLLEEPLDLGTGPPGGPASGPGG